MQEMKATIELLLNCNKLIVNVQAANHMNYIRLI